MKFTVVSQMKLSFAMKLAWQNVKGNKEVNLPYIISSMVTVAIFFTFSSLIEHPVVQDSPNSLLVLFQMGTIIAGVFSFIFIFYANSFLMKRRKKEIGLYNVLGLEKGHIARVMAIETCINADVVDEEVEDSGYEPSGETLDVLRPIEEDDYEIESLR